MSSEPSIHDLASSYAINAVDDDERLAFEAHLETCRRCQEEVAAATEAIAALATDAVTDPPLSLRDNVLASIAKTEQSNSAERPGDPAVDRAGDRAVEPPADLAGRRPRRIIRAWPLVAAAAVVIVAAASFRLLQSDQSTEDRISVEEVAAAPDAVELELDGTDGTAGTVNVVWSAELDVVSVVADDLVDPGPGRVYELWFVLEDGGVAPAGLFVPQSGVFSGVLEVDGLTAAGWGVTIEPEGGSDQPTGEILYLAEL